MLLLSMCESLLSAIQDAAVEKAHSNGVAYKKKYLLEQDKVLAGRECSEDELFLHLFFTPFRDWCQPLGLLSDFALICFIGATFLRLMEQVETVDSTTSPKTGTQPNRDALRSKNIDPRLIQVVCVTRFECLSGEDWEFHPTNTSGLSN